MKDERCTGWKNGQRTCDFSVRYSVGVGTEQIKGQKTQLRMSWVMIVSFQFNIFLGYSYANGNSWNVTYAALMSIEFDDLNLWFDE